MEVAENYSHSNILTYINNILTKILKILFFFIILDIVNSSKRY